MKLFCVIVLCCSLAASADTCDAKLQADCGNEMKQGRAPCIQCAEQHNSDLKAAGCTVKGVEALCNGEAPTPPGPSPPGPSPPGPSPPAPKGGDDLKKVLLDNSDQRNAIGGRCLDGSPAGYYYGPPSGTGNDKWSIYLKGGGACYTEESCKARAVMKNGLGSSTFWKDGEFGGDDNSFTSNSSTVNPDFYDAHRVYVPYCTGDVHSGTRTSATAETWGFWFDGHLNFKRILDDLKTKYGLSDAKQVMLGGSSAGGFGTFFNADFLASEVPNATVKAVPVAGWFVPGDPNAVPAIEGHPLNYTAKEVTHTNKLSPSPSYALWQPYAHPACAKDIGAQYCGSVHNLYKYVDTPLLVVENQYDTNQIFDTVGFCPPRSPATKAKTNDYIAYYGSLMRSSIEPQIQGHGQTKAKGKDGLFFPSCLAHGGFADTTLKQVSNYKDLIGDWFFQRGKYTSHILIDDCNMTDGLPCNPTCTHRL